LNGKQQKCADSAGFTPRYNLGLVAGEREKVGSKITFSIDITKIVGKYIIEVDVVKTGFSLRDWFTVLENHMMHGKLKL
jgi:hypothetical protein